MFLVLQHLESNSIQKIIENYNQKYFIYVLMLNQLDYEKLLEIESIKLIENIETIQLKEIHQFNYENFKKKKSGRAKC